MLTEQVINSRWARLDGVEKGHTIIYGESYAIVDVGEMSPTKGKILVLIDDEITAGEFVADLSQRQCTVAVRRVVRSRGHVVSVDEPVLHLA